MNVDFLDLKSKTMQYVLAVGRQQSITKAAGELYISQPALSRYIQNLERRIGFKLFNRIGHQFIPTYEGERIMEYARRIGEIETHMQQEFIDLQKLNVGRLRLALPPLRSPYVLPSIIPPFKKKFPQVEIHVHEVHAQFLEAFLADGKVDFAILNTASKNPNVTTEIIRQDEVVLAISPDHPLAGIPRVYKGSHFPWIDLHRFRDEEFILQHEDQRTRQVANEIFEEKKMEPKILLTTRSIEAAIKMVVQNCGVCFAAETHIKHLITPRDPVYFSVGIPISTISLSLSYLDGVYQPTYFADFKEIVRRNL